MPTRKKTPQSKSKPRSAKKSSSKKTSRKSAMGDGGPLPPYGNPIREAIGRGDLRQMRALAGTTRRWLRDVQAALTKLEKSITKLER